MTLFLAWTLNHPCTSWKYQGQARSCHGQSLLAIICEYATKIQTIWGRPQNVEAQYSWQKAMMALYNVLHVVSAMTLRGGGDSRIMMLIKKKKKKKKKKKFKK